MNLCLRPKVRRMWKGEVIIMKRSEINVALKELESMVNEYKISLPPFCHFLPEEWESKGHEYDEIRDNMLGWDITDYGLGDFNKVGFSLITIRNGNLKMQDKYKKTYAEKLLYLKEGQYAPNHDVHVHLDGREVVVKAGTQVRLTPGESISIQPYMYHDFEVEPGTGAVLIGEVSQCNDDNTDNRFYEPIGRFPTIEEDEPPYRLLCNEYPPAK